MSGEKNKKNKKVNREAAADFKGTWKKLLEYSSKYRIELIISSVLSLSGAIVNIFSPILSGKVINALSFNGPEGGLDFDYIIKILALLFVMYSVLGICSCVGNYLTSNVSVRITYRMRKQASEKIDRLPLSYFDKETYGEVLSRITNDVDVLVSSLTQTLSQILSSVTMLIGIVFMMFSISWEMTLLSFSGLPVASIFISLMFSISRKYFKRYQKQLGLINGHIEEMYSGHSVVRAFNGEKTSIEKFDKLNNNMYNLAWKSEFLSGFIGPVMELVSSLTYVGLCILGGYLAIKKGLSVGNIFAFLSYSTQFMRPLISVAGISGTLQQIAVAAERVFEFLDAEENPADRENCIKTFGSITEFPEIKGEVKFTNINFGYNRDNLIIKNFSFNTESGQTIAIVGPTGAGKTTIIKLLSGFYDVKEGSILIDGHDIRDFRRNDLHSLFGIVFQEPWLFSGTILENIRYGKPNSTSEEVEEAARLAYADGFINALPNGYETVINESSNNISQGEKQLLTIARAILANHKILILDEATSSVDTRTEIQIQKALKNLLKDKTSFVIAHRLSTVREADIIIVLNKGIIEEKGNHKELMDKKGMYYNMYVSQFKYEEYSN